MAECFREFPNKYKPINSDFDGGYRQGLDCALELVSRSKTKKEGEESIINELKKCPIYKSKRRKNKSKRRLKNER